jgi:hypothetical protein
MQIPRKPLEDLDDTACCTASGTSNLYSTPLFLFRKHPDNNTLDLQLTGGSVLVTAHEGDVGRER